jgi:hypothetical protein
MRSSAIHLAAGRRRPAVLGSSFRTKRAGGFKQRSLPLSAFRAYGAGQAHNRTPGAEAPGALKRPSPPRCGGTPTSNRLAGIIGTPAVNPGREKRETPVLASVSRLRKRLLRAGRIAGRCPLGTARRCRAPRPLPASMGRTAQTHNLKLTHYPKSPNAAPRDRARGVSGTWRRWMLATPIP